MIALDRMTVDDTPARPEAKAAAIHAQLGSDLCPVPVHQIARALDIVDIQDRPLASFEGLLLTEAEREFGTIAVNAGSSWQRRRFSVAHELGHFLCDWHVSRHQQAGFGCTRSDMVAPVGDPIHLRQEREANTFAIELLAPAAAMKPWLRRFPDLEHVIEIHKSLDISKAAAARRYVSLHPKSVAVVFAKDGRVSFSERGPEFPFIRLNAGDVLPASPQRLSDDVISEMLNADPQDWAISTPGAELACQQLAQIDGHSITLLYLERQDS